MFRDKWEDLVAYEIYCKSFCDSDGDGLGDLPGVISKLPLLKELGVNCIWFTPIFPSPQADNGYDVADYEGINPDYGTMDDFKTLLEKAHELGIKVILDMVLNHSSDEHRWFQESRKSKDNPYRDYYIWRAPKEDGSEPNNWGNKFFEGNGSAWTFDEQTGEYYFHNYSSKMPELNWDCRAMREDIYAMLRRWLDMGVDGFRMDVITRLQKAPGFPDSKKPLDVNGYVFDVSLNRMQPGLHEIIHELRERTWADYDTYVVGEAGVSIEEGKALILPEREELDSLYHFMIVNRNKPRVTVPQYKQIQEDWAELYDMGCCTTQHMSNHDQARQVSKFGNDSEYRVESAKLLGALIHTMPGVPYIYQGEEIGMPNTYFDSIDDYDDRYTVGEYYAHLAVGEDGEALLKRLQPNSRDNARRPIPWNGGLNGGFTTGTPWLKMNPSYPEINYEADLQSPDSIFRWYQQLIELRHSHAAVRRGRLVLLEKEHPALILYKRIYEDDALLVVANASDAEQSLTDFPAVGEADKTLLLCNYGTERENTADALRPWEVRIYQI